ncbi:MAG: hypothetical protein LBR76_00685 [Oscillospiraceae bacterium]|nr:hypothetical protein [Oscillospiraceae bacterium]
MKKLAIIVNGKPESGKDFLCDAAIAKFRARKISSIDPILPIAKLGGWDGVKTQKSRKLLSDLKHAFTEFNDLSHQYVLEKYRDFLQSEDSILFVHIRERDQIEAFKQAAEHCVTILIRRPDTERTVGNASDDGINRIAYDYIYDNTHGLTDAAADFNTFILDILHEHEIPS